MSSDYLVYIATLILSWPFLSYTDKNKNREIDPFLIPVKPNSITLEYATEKWEYATYFNCLLPKTSPSTKDVEVFRDILLSIHGETYNLLNDHLLEHLRGLCHKYQLRTGCSKLMHARNIAAIHNAILASSNTFSDEYLKSVLEVIKHPLYHVTYWIDDVVHELEKKYEIWFPSIVKNFVRKLAHHTFNWTCMLDSKEAWIDLLGLFDVIIRKEEEGSKGQWYWERVCSHQKINYGWSIYIFWVPCVH